MFDKMKLYCFCSLFLCLGNVISTGQLSIHFLYLDTRGQLWNGEPCNAQCSPGLTICISLRAADTQDTCNTPGTQEPIIRTQIYSHVNNVTFGARLGEVNNPVVYKTTDKFDGDVYISIEVNNYNYPNSSFEAIDRVYIHFNTSAHAPNSDIQTYTGSRSVNPTLTAIQWRHSEVSGANQLGIANGGMGIFKNTMQMVLLAIALVIGVLLILSMCCCLLIINKVKSRERIIVDNMPVHPRRGRRRRNSKTGLLENQESENKYNTFNGTIGNSRK